MNVDIGGYLYALCAKMKEYTLPLSEYMWKLGILVVFTFSEYLFYIKGRMCEMIL